MHTSFKQTQGRIDKALGRKLSESDQPQLPFTSSTGLKTGPVVGWIFKASDIIRRDYTFEIVKDVRIR
jgi:hypothetical protein